MSETIAARVQLRRGTIAQWTAANPTLLAGEAGYETDTGRLRIGDGTTAFLSLPYASISEADLTSLASASLDKATYDPQDISADVFNRENHTGTQDVSTITGLGELATRNRATVAQIRSLGSDAAPTAERIAEAAALISPAGASDWAPDWEDFISANWVLEFGNRTLQNPTNVIPGTTRVVRAAGNSGTGRTISFGSNYQGDLNGGPVTSGSPILYTLFAATATEIWVSAMEAD